MTKYRSVLLAGIVMLLISALSGIEAVARAIQFPSGRLAAFFLGAPCAYDSGSLLIFTHPQTVVSIACSGVHFFAFLTGLGAGYWCNKNWKRWISLLPLCYLITLFTNAARITMAWQFRRFSTGHLPGWLQIYVHIGIGIVCFLSIATLCLYLINQNALQRKDTP
ncbi:MAG: archaeosortase/exosortase family protein [Pontiellaceae bacterium]|nr:archaeosortase/exosortase family protein [Pontiellaceae bacterium]MBN2786609.1 archaeosortase/exosortase family protein [Pontiellaceae bacterium]